MTKRLRRGNLQVSEILANFIENEALPDTNISPNMFWEKFETILNQFFPKNKELLKKKICDLIMRPTPKITLPNTYCCNHCCFCP